MSKNFCRRLVSSPLVNAAMAVLSILCMAPSSCGGGGGGGGGGAFESYTVPDQTTQSLTNAQVSGIVNQAANEAVARHTSAIIAVVDRVGNVLGVATVAVTGVPMATAAITATCLAQPCATINSPDATSGGLEEVNVPTAAAAIAKAITGAYLSSGGNAFTTRTANQIIQQNFPLPPVGNNVPGGPLFGVQFSQLVCSDLTTISGTGGGVTNGPHRSPLGLAADPGGLPLYISGVLVGGIGVMSTASYSIVPTTALNDNADEGIALAGQSGYSPPPPIEASDITVGGVALNYVGASIVHSSSSFFGGGGVITPTAVPGYYTVNGGAGGPYYAGQTYGSTAGSGILSDAVADAGVGGPFYSGTNAYVLVNSDGTPRYPPVAGAVLPSGDGLQITAAEAQALVANALRVANQTRAGIRIPTNAAANITASVVDLDGNILAIGRNVDAPVFGIDVSLQKARSAVFFSRVDAKNAFTEINHIDVVHPGTASSPTTTFAYYMNANAVTVINPPLFNSGTAFSLLAVGALERPYLPDGENNPAQSNGPLSLPFLDPGVAGDWSPFSTGVQTDLIKPDLAAYLAGGLANFPAGYAGCGTDTGLPANASTERASVGTAIDPTGPAAAVSVTQLANGLQIFSGGFPIYRSNGELVGAIGISGDGILQDALVAFIGVQGDGSIGVAPVGSSIGGVETLFNAPAGVRPDAGLDLDTGTPGRAGVVPNTNPLGGPFTPRFIQCPPAPWITSTEQTPCGS